MQNGLSDLRSRMRTALWSGSTTGQADLMKRASEVPPEVENSGLIRHSASMAALTGGGLRAKPGEASLAHNGVLFLDELPEYSAQALDSLRQPLETGRVTVARANSHVTFPARFQLVAAMNPCRCGHLNEPQLKVWDIGEIATSFST